MSNRSRIQKLNEERIEKQMIINVMSTFENTDCIMDSIPLEPTETLLWPQSRNKRLLLMMSLLTVIFYTFGCYVTTFYPHNRTLLSS